MADCFKIEDDVKFLRKQIKTLQSHGAMFKKRADTLKELLSEEVASHQITKNMLTDACDERDEYRNKFNSLLYTVSELKPGTRITKEVLDKLKQMK